MDTILQKINSFLDEIIDDSSLFLVNLEIQPTNNIKIYLDGDSGITINTISRINKAIYNKIEEEGLFENGNYSLEVSSSGVDEPLKLFRQYKKNIGRKVMVTLKEGENIEGELAEVESEKIKIKEIINKKKETVTKEIPFDDIQQTVVQITF